MKLKNFSVLVFVAIFFTCSVAQATVENFEIENETDNPFDENSPINIEYEGDDQPSNYDEEIPELPEEYKTPPEYGEDEKPPENGQPTVEDEGLEFLVYNKNGVMAFAIIADHEKYQLRPILAKDQIRGRATVSQMTKNLDDIAIINASYFMTNGSLIGVTKIDGEIIGVDDFYRSAIGIYDDGTAVFGRVKYMGEINFYGDKIPVNGVNCERGENSLVVYNSYFGATTGTNDFGVEIVVVDGVVTDIFYENGNNAIPFGGYIISAHGAAADLLKSVQVNDELIINQEILSSDGNFNEIPTLVGAGPRLVMDGKIYVTASEEKFPADIRVGRAPRSAVGVTAYGDYILAVVDGRQAHSKGCTLQEWAEILLNEFGAFQAINLDGGGSTELIVKDKLVNKPSDGRERMVGSALAILPK